MLKLLLCPVSWDEVGEATTSVTWTQAPDNILKEKLAEISADCLHFRLKSL